MVSSDSLRAGNRWHPLKICTWLSFSLPYLKPVPAAVCPLQEGEDPSYTEGTVGRVTSY